MRSASLECLRLLLCLLLGAVGVVACSLYAAYYAARFFLLPHPHEGLPLLYACATTKPESFNHAAEKAAPSYCHANQ